MASLNEAPPKVVIRDEVRKLRKWLGEVYPIPPKLSSGQRTAHVPAHQYPALSAQRLPVMDGVNIVWEGGSGIAKQSYLIEHALARSASLDLHGADKFGRTLAVSAVQYPSEYLSGFTCVIGMKLCWLDTAEVAQYKMRLPVLSPEALEVARSQATSAAIGIVEVAVAFALFAIAAMLFLP